MSFSSAWEAWFDGATVPNPGLRGIGVLLKGPDGQRVEISREVGHGTNNEAEYLALIAALEAAVENGVSALVVRGDSQLVINQVVGKWSVNSQSLEGLFLRVRELAKQVGQVKIRWVGREENAEADALSKRALGGLAPVEVDPALWGKQSEISKPLGLSGIAIGRKMDEAGLRAEGKPTELAVELGAALLVPNNFGTEVFWHKTRLVEVLKEKGVLE